MKSGIDYFPLDVTLDSKFELIEAEFGLTGFGVVVHLLQEIYGKEGYYIEWTEEVALLFARKVGAGGSVVSEIIEASVRRGMFDKEKYEKYRVLTSSGIQRRYFEAVSRRKVLEVDYNILLVDVAQICPNVDIRAKNADISSENAYIPKQSKVEESKVKKRRVEESVLPPGGGRTPRAKRFTPPPPPADDAALVEADYLKRVNKEASPASLEELRGFVAALGKDVCIRAIDIALDGKKANWPYIRAILRDKQRRGVKCLADWDALEAQREQGCKETKIQADERRRNRERAAAAKESEWMDQYLQEWEERKI